jgi:hypothetical protein
MFIVPMRDAAALRQEGNVSFPPASISGLPSPDGRSQDSRDPQGTQAARSTMSPTPIHTRHRSRWAMSFLDLSPASQ